MEPKTHFTDYPSLYGQIPSLYGQIISYDIMTKKMEELAEKLVDINIRERLGGNEGIHNVGAFGNDPSLRSA
jgi:hypothetical protein